MRRQILDFVKELAASWSEQRVPSMGAALAYYAMFSIAPLLFIAISIAGLFFGADAVRGAVFEQLADLMGQNSAQAIQEMLAHLSEPKTGVLGTAIGAAGLLLGASGVFAELQSAMDVIWRVPPQAKPKGIWGFVRTRLLTFGMVLGLGFLVVISLLLSTALAALGKWWGGYLGGWDYLAQALDLVVSLLVLTGVFGAIFKFMPSRPVQWRDVWVGAAMTAVLFTVGKFLIGLYLGKSSVASSFGAFGSVVIMVVWVYYSAQIFYLGAEFGWVYAHRFGSRRDPARMAPPPLQKPIPESERVPMQDRRRPKAYPRLSYPTAFLAGAVLGALRSVRGQH
jgi:membrane protein